MPLGLRFNSHFYATLLLHFLGQNEPSMTFKSDVRLSLLMNIADKIWCDSV